jgi:hypothetical protein
VKNIIRKNLIIGISLYQGKKRLLIVVDTKLVGVKLIVKQKLEVHF